MEILKWKDVEETKVEKIAYKGTMNEVKGITLRWLSKSGEDDMGLPEYGLRFFTAQPKGEIPIHNHFYIQTMYILSGRFECWSFDGETNELIEKKVCGPGDSIYIPSMEPHGMRNLSDTEEATFLCCIGTVHEDKTI